MTLLTQCHPALDARSREFTRFRTKCGMTKIHVFIKKQSGHIHARSLLHLLHSFIILSPLLVKKHDFSPCLAKSPLTKPSVTSLSFLGVIFIPFERSPFLSIILKAFFERLFMFFLLLIKLFI